MNRLFLFVFVLLLGATAVSAQPSSSHTVSVDVDPVNQIGVSGDVSIGIGTQIGTEVTDQTASYSAATNAQSDRKIEVSVSSASSVDHLRLEVESARDLGGSAQPVELTAMGSSSTKSGDLVSGFSKTGASDVQLTYRAEASYSFNPANTAELTVVYTLRNDN